MFDVLAFDTPPGPWQRTCDNPGPYAIRRPTPKFINRLEVLTCTRPAGHPPDQHQHATAAQGVIASWAADGTPIYPPRMEAREHNATGDTV